MYFNCKDLNFQEEILYVINELILKPSELCSLFISNCGHFHGFDNDWNISIPEKPAGTLYFALFFLGIYPTLSQSVLGLSIYVTLLSRSFHSVTVVELLQGGGGYTAVGIEPETYIFKPDSYIHSFTWSPEKPFACILKKFWIRGWHCFFVAKINFRCEISCIFINQAY